MLGQLTAGQDVKIIKDLGLSATAVFGLFISIFIGIGLVSKEVERRSIYSLLSKPIHRYQLVLGKYAGLTLTLAVNVAVMAVALYAVLVYKSWGVPALVQTGWDAPALDPALLKAIALIFLELMLITAIATFFSTFSTPILSAAFTFGLFIVGHFSGDLRNFDQFVDSELAARVARGLYWILPDLAQFDVKDSRRPWTCGAVRLHDAHVRVRPSLHRDVAVAQHVYLFAAGFQVRAITKPRSVTKRTNKRVPISCSCVCS